MKAVVFPILGIAMIFAACKEGAPPVDFGTLANTVKDTNYVLTTPEMPQQRVVVMEEFTGVRCSNCPSGHAIIKAIEDANADRFIAIGIQPNGVKQATPVEERESGSPDIVTRKDNRTPAGTSIANDVYGVLPSIPIAGINRTTINGSMFIERSTWAGMVADGLVIPPAANIIVTSTYNCSSRQAIIKVRISYASSVAKVQKLTVALIENNIIDAQEFTDHFEKDYVHQHVLRDVLTPATGATILGDKATKVAGQVYERTFIYNVNDAWNPDNCEVVAFVSNDQGADKEILQGAEVHLK